MTTKDILIKSGLSEGEALVYEFLLQEGEGSAGAIAKKITGLKRGNIYNLLKSLIEKRLVEQFEKNKTAHFRLEHPSHLKDYLGKQAVEIEQTKKALLDFIPTITSEYNLSHQKPGIHYFEGEEGIKKIYDDTVEDNPDKKVFVFRSYLDDQKLGIEFFNSYSRKRANSKIKTQIISPKKVTLEIKMEDEKLLKERKFWENFETPAEIDIYHDKVAIISFEKELIGTIIENKPIAQTLQKIFEQVWGSL